MLLISCQDMKTMDSYAINNVGIPSIVLMENAALKVIKNIDLDSLDSFTIVCGTGNNGGDGLAIARHLILKGKVVDLFIIGNMDKGTEDFNTNLKILKNIDVDVNHISSTVDINKLTNSLKNNDLTIDSIFGIGIARDVEGFFKETIETINKYSKNILAVDIPSGLDGDTGKVLDTAIKATRTITFHHMKKGLVENKDSSGEIIVEDIGIPDKATEMVLGIE